MGVCVSYTGEGSTHQVSEAAGRPKEEAAAGRPLTDRTEKAVRKLMAPPESSREGASGLD
jgi:hypothetical protein